jgi:VWFA-related protein
MKFKSILAITIAAALAVSALHGQRVTDDELRWGSRPYVPTMPGTIRVQTNMVEVGVVVRDSHGGTVGGLQQSDFEVYDEGKPQKIAFFAVENSPSTLSTEPVEPPTTSATPVPPPRFPAVPKPRYVALYFDDTSLKPGDVALAAKAAQQFIRESMEPGDKIGIFTSSNTVSLTFTDDKQKILDTLGQVRTHLRRPDYGPGSCPRMSVLQAYEIMKIGKVHSPAFDLGMAAVAACGNCTVHPEDCVMYQAQQTVSLAEQYSLETMGSIIDVVRYLGKMQGRRMLLLASDGFWTQTLGSQQDKLVAGALQVKVVINSLDAKGLYAETPVGDFSDGPPPSLVSGKGPSMAMRGDLTALEEQYRHDQAKVMNDPMSVLAEDTGGRFFHNSNDLGRGMREMAAAPEFSYVLGFSPDGVKPNGSFHALKVKLIQSRDVTLEARRGYYAPSAKKESDTGPLAMLQKLDREVLAADDPAEISTEVTTEPGKLATGESVLKVSVHVDVSKLPFQRRKDRSVERLFFVTALFDTNNSFLTGVEGIMDLTLKDATLTQISTQGVDAKLSLQAPPGSYKLRQVVEEIATGRITAISHQVEIH